MRDNSLGLRAVIILIIALALAQSLTIYAVPWHYIRNLVLSDDAQPASPSKPLLQPVPPPIIIPMTPTVPTGPSTPVGPKTPTGPSSPTSPKPTSPPGQKPAQPGDQPSQLPKPTQPGQQPSQLPTPTNPSTLPPSPVNPVPREVYSSGMKYIVQFTDNADLLENVLKRMGKKIGGNGGSFRVDNPEKVKEEVRLRLKKAGLYSKLDKILRNLYRTSIEEVIERVAYGYRYPDTTEGLYKVELKAAYDLATNFPLAVKQIIQDGILQEQGKAMFKWYVNTGFRELLDESARKRFDVVYPLLKDLGGLFGVPVFGTDRTIVWQVWWEHVYSRAGGEWGLALILLNDNLPKASKVISIGVGEIIITPVMPIKVKDFGQIHGSVVCLNFGEKNYCYDKDGNQIDPSLVAMS